MSTRTLPFTQVDVFGAEPLLGNPVAVVHDADGLDTPTMQRLATWTNLSETVFVLPPTDPRADYRLRIFTTGGELPFAGHPTLGAAHAWREVGGAPHTTGEIVQECAAGLVALRPDDGVHPVPDAQDAAAPAPAPDARWAFAAPPLTRYEPVEEALLERVTRGLGVTRADVLDAAWLVNGPEWLAVRLGSAEQVLAVRADAAVVGDLFVGLVGPHRDPGPGSAVVEVRGLMGTGQEDPVTGSLNAGLARWLTDTRLVPDRYVAAQGTAIGRAGRVHVRVERQEGRIWVGGDTCTILHGEVRIHAAAHT